MWRCLGIIEVDNEPACTVVSTDRWSLRQVVSTDRWSLRQVLLYVHDLYSINTLFNVYVCSARCSSSYI